MIADTLEHSGLYAGMFPWAGQAFSIIRDLNLSALPDGVTTFPDHPVTVSVMRRQGLPREEARLESHRKFIDIHVPLEGTERIGWKPAADCRAPDGPFDPDRDLGFFHDRPGSIVELRPGMFAVFFPADAHAPLIGEGEILKAVLKIPVTP